MRRWDGTPVEAGPDHDTYDRVAEVIDRAEQALEDGDGDTFCWDLRVTKPEGDAYPDCLLRMRSIRDERIADIRIRSLLVQGDRADVHTTGGVGDLRWSLVRVDGEWLVDYVD